MADAEKLELKTKFGELVAHGTSVFIVIALTALAATSVWEHRQRSEEHEEILSAIQYQACLARLNIYVTTAKDPGGIRLNAMPTDLWNCLPKFMTEEKREPH